MRIATWNVNSIRSRVDRVLAFLERSETDVLALQETKCRDDQFPRTAFEALGYEVAHVGHSQWNGVAVVSRIGLTDVAVQFPGQPGFAKASPAADDADVLIELPPQAEARALGATCGGVRVWSLYVPHGRALGDPHFTYKLSWLAALHHSAQAWLEQDPAAQVALLGDWNVAPLNTDVWNPARFTGTTHTSPAEREAFAAFASAGYTEVTRELIPEPHTYTYWDYKELSFPRNYGMRIDFAYVSPALRARVTGARIERDERKGKGASDHVPVVVDLDRVLDQTAVEKADEATDQTAPLG